MYRLNYRNFGDHETLVVNHTVDIDGTNHAGVRWYELRRIGGGTWTLFQQGTYAGDAAPPDVNHRWMASVNIDRFGNIAAGYSLSSSSTFPSIRYVGRVASDPLGTLPQGETTLFAGSGAQISSGNRWGDYSSMSVDPVDDCTFWYVNQYYASTGGFDWHTRIGSFRFPACIGTATPTPTSTPTPTATTMVTLMPTSTPTNTPTSTPTSTPTNTPTSTPTNTPTSTPTATPTATPCILGDINCDGIVDIRDYGIWRQNFGATDCGNRADLNNDCIVDIRDYGVWRQNFGHTAGAAPRAVPPVGTTTRTLLPRGASAGLSVGMWPYGGSGRVR